MPLLSLEDLQLLADSRRIIAELDEALAASLQADQAKVKNVVVCDYLCTRIKTFSKK